MSTIKTDNIVNRTGDQDSGLDLGTNDTIKLKIADSTKWTLNSSGNLFPSSATQGIVLGNTSDVAANRLEDYEEGTYTPTYTAASSGGTISYQYQSGTYTKIGRLCRVWIDMSINSASGMSGHPQITLPFAASAQADIDMGSFTPWSIDNTFTSSRHATMWINVSTSLMLMYTWADDTNHGHAALAINVAGRISGGLMYQTA